MNSIYQKAHEGKGNRGAPIFLADLLVSKSRAYGANRKIKKEFFSIKKIVVKGTEAEIKNCPFVMRSALLKLTGDKTKLARLDRSAYKIEKIEIISQHGYAIK